MHKIPIVFKIQDSLINSQIEGNGIPHSLYVKFEINLSSLTLFKLSTLFSRVKLRANFSNSSIDSKLRFFMLALGYTSKFCPINQEIFGFFNVTIAGLLSSSKFKKKMKN